MPSTKEKLKFYPETLKQDIQTMDIWDLWEIEWKNAYRFFNSKGNINTKNEHKTRWYKEFKEMIQNAKNKK